MKKIAKIVISCIVTCALAISVAACGTPTFDAGKQITVVARELSSGTREAFDTVVTDGTGFLQQKDADGVKQYYTTDKAVVLNKTGDVKTKVASDKQAIGYISLGSVDSSVKVLKVNGVAPSAATVLDGTYKIQRPFVIMTNKDVSLTPVTADFMAYLKSAAAADYCETAGTVYLSDPAQRGTASSPIAVTEYVKKNSLPEGGQIIIRGSTSMEQFIFAAAAGYAKLYGVDASNLFSIELQGSSVGKSEVKKDTNGNVIGLSSAAVNDEKINAFNVCLDAVAVIVNNDNDLVNDVSLAQLYSIYTGKVTTFDTI